MSITIPGVPEFLTREQYLAPLRAIGFDPADIREIRYAHDGVHALVIARDEHGRKRLDPNGSGYYKHRVFIPIRDEDGDERTTRITPVKN
ncbi:hypothetical protein [Sanguibacter massiliensis]|uniref:hypothetical protein n=1 Tax=Sanguibacter massiliensis TaxID=1973217 RepID=UPI000C84DBBB|nr:hypothetical protein [Sanguibacter massiliensis]